MKTIPFIFACFLVAGFLACQKESTPASPDNSLTGKWRFNYSAGGFSGNDTVWPPARTELVLVLNTDSTYTSTSNGSVLQNGVYNVIAGQSTNGYLIRFDKDPNKDLIITHNDPELVLTDPYTEPYARHFSRVQ